MTHRGLLLTMTEPPPEMEEEFNAWYDDEHMAERLSIPGFRSARRWVADVRPGEGKYLATYELDSPDVLKSREYLSFFDRPTPWTKRCLAKCVVFKRWACEQVEPGDADPRPEAGALLLAAGQHAEIPVAVSGALASRSFVASDGSPANILLVELPVARPAIAQPGKAGLVRLYRAY
jgi:hypothetical protein